MPTKIEGTRRLLGAVAWLGVMVLALALFVTGRVGVDSVPTWFRP